MCDEKLNFETIQLYEGQTPQTTTGAAAVPIYQTSFYVFKNSDHASSLREYLFKYK